MGELGDSNSQVDGHLLPKDSLNREIGKGGDGHGDGETIVEALSPSAPVLDKVNEYKRLMFTVYQ